MKLTTLLSAISLSSEREHEVTRVEIDSRKTDEQCLFVALKGTNADGHDYLAQVSASGCRAAVVGSTYEGETFGLALIRVPDTRAALSHLCARLSGDPQKEMRFILITGTNGKTSTAQMIRAIMSACGISARVIGTLEGPMTTPDPQFLFPLLRRFADEGVEYVIMETSSHALSLRKLDAIEPDYGIFTNLTPDHLDFHGTMEEYFKAKASLFRMCRFGIVNRDDAYAERIIEGASCPILTYSATHGDADFAAYHVELAPRGIRYDCLTGDRLFRVNCPIPGAFTVSNTLAALACAYHIGITPGCIRAALAGLGPIPGRIERVVLPTSRFSVYIDFAHTPDALENILTTLRATLPEGGKLTLLFGCGGDRDKSKRPMMGQIAARLADDIVVTSDNPRSEEPGAIIDDILAGIPEGKHHVVIPERKAAIEYTLMHAMAGDIILLSGKGHETYQIDAEGKHPFDERTLIKEAYQKRFG